MARREGPDVVGDDEGIALAISEESHAADGRLAASPKSDQLYEQGRRKGEVL